MLDRFLESRLSIHLLAYGTLIVVTLLLFPGNGSFSSDDGAYAGQVFALQQGDWALERPVTNIASVNEGWVNSYISSDGPLPYQQHPTYVYLLLFSTSVFGETYGLGVPSAVGAIVCVVAAWLLAIEYDRRSAPVAFWIVGLSPILVNSTTFWAHTLAAGFIGLGLWAAVRVMQGRYSSPLGFWVLASVVGLTNAAAILVRTEAVLWFAGLAVGFVFLSRSKRVTLLMATAMVPTVGAFVADRLWSQAVLDRYEIIGLSSTEEASWLASRIPAGFHLLLSPSEGAGALFVALGLALITYGAVKFRLQSESGLAVRLILVGSTLFIIPVVLDPSTVSGLVAAWPILIAAGVIGSQPKRLTRTYPISWLLVPSGLLVLAVFITQYAASGGLEWGARYLSPAFVALGVWAAVNLGDFVKKAPYAMTALVIGPAILGLAVTYQHHVRHADFVSSGIENQPDIVIANQPAGTRIAWSSLPTAWYTADEDNIDVLLAEVVESDAERIAILGFDQIDVTSPGGYRIVQISDQLVHLVAS